MEKKFLSFIEQLRFYKEFFFRDMERLAKNHYNIFLDTYRRLQKYIDLSKKRTILDVGCGRQYPQTLLFHSRGHKVIGIDIFYISFDKPPLKYYKSLRKNGLIVATGDLIDDILLKNRRFYKTLRSLCGFSRCSNPPDIRQMNAEEMTFQDELFDIVISNCVFEHIRNVPKAVFEIHRVLKPSGICYITIHLFTSLSGGHHFYWQEPQKVKPPYKIPPWDHLREKKFPLPPVYLNKLREKDYISLFEQKFQILEIIREKEGEELLQSNPEIREELSEYTEEELVTRTLTIIGRKRR